MSTQLNAQPRFTFADPQTLPWATELILLGGSSRSELLKRLEQVAQFVEAHPDVPLTDLAYTLNCPLPPGEYRLALVVKSLSDLGSKLARATEKLANPDCRTIRDVAGIYYTESPLGSVGKLAMLFPGEGAPYLGMLEDMLPHFPEMTEFFAECEEISERTGRLHNSYSKLIFQGSRSPEELAQAAKELHKLSNAMFTVMMADWLLWLLLRQLGFRPDATAGHSMGELIALWVADAITVDADFVFRSTATTAELEQSPPDQATPFILLAVGAGRPQIEAVIAELGVRGVHIAIDNCPHQTVLVGPPAAMQQVEAAVQARRWIAEQLSFSRPYHTPMFEPSLGPLDAMFRTATFMPAKIPVYACATTQPFPDDPEAMRQLTVHSYAAPVRFTETIEQMYADGVRIFLEVGPRGNLSTFVEDILRGRDILALPTNMQRRPGVTQLHHALGQLAVHQVPMNLEHLYTRREPQRLAFDRTPAPTSATSSRQPQLMEAYFGVMEQFLDLQTEIIETYLQRRGQPSPAGTISVTTNPNPSATRPPWPMLGDLIEFQPGQSLVMRRRLDLAEDTFVHDHTVGGRGASRVDPDQNGLPVLPMTFDLEILAEVASVLVPGKVVVAVEKVRLSRWLPYDIDEPTSIEVRAQRSTLDPAESPIRVEIEIRDLGNTRRPATSRWVVMQGQVVLDDQYPEPPHAKPWHLTHEMTSRVPLDVLYKNLFHGPRFHGVRSTDRFGDEGIESQVEVLPRHNLFTSNPDPQFVLDPILLDVGMHPFASWHLEQEDQSGRILLPVEVGRLELFGPCPEVGSQLTSRGYIEDTSPRHFDHGMDLIYPDGRIWCRMHKARYWRFYVPFGDVNFHGPKDEYFISQECPEFPPTPTGPCLMRLELRPDILQLAMRMATAYVTLTPDELRQFRDLTGPEKEHNQWLYRRIVAKDALRTLWYWKTGTRLFPADIELEIDDQGHAGFRHRGQPDSPLQAFAAVVELEGVMFALAARTPRVGLAIQPRSEMPADADGASVPLRLARQAVAQAFGCTSEADLASIVPYDDTVPGETYWVQIHRGSNAQAPISVGLRQTPSGLCATVVWEHDDVDALAATDSPRPGQHRSQL